MKETNWIEVSPGRFERQEQPAERSKGERVAKRAACLDLSEAARPQDLTIGSVQARRSFARDFIRGG